jgi:hypothetical protein
MELDPNLLFFSENSMLLESLSLEKSLLLTLKNSLKITKPPLLWDLTKNLLEKSLEKITQLYLSLALILKLLKLLKPLFKLLLLNYTEKSFYLPLKSLMDLEKDSETILELPKLMFPVLELSTPPKMELS